MLFLQTGPYYSCPRLPPTKTIRSYAHSNGHLSFCPRRRLNRLPHPHLQTRQLPSAPHIRRIQTQPNLSSFASSATAAANSFDPLMNHHTSCWRHSEDSILAVGERLQTVYPSPLWAHACVTAHPPAFRLDGCQSEWKEGVAVANRWFDMWEARTWSPRTEKGRNASDDGRGETGLVRGMWEDGGAHHGRGCVNVWVTEINSVCKSVLPGSAM